MEQRTAYVDALQLRLEELREGIARDKLKVRELLEAIAVREAQVGHIVELLAAEGASAEESSLAGQGPMSVSDIAHEVLAKQPEPRPIHYRDLVDLIMAEGKLIPGRNPGANLISHMSRDERFVRTDRGTYALAEWGFKPAKKGRHPRRRTTKKE